MDPTLDHFSRRCVLKLFLIVALSALLSSCASDKRHILLIGINDQRLVLLDQNIPIANYSVSTSKFGVGDGFGTNRTPIGWMKVRKKIGANAPSGAVFKSRMQTGEILPVDAPGRDPIVTRILWLDGLEAKNRHAYKRHIYIHGTPEERTIGTPASYGCIRMRSRDIIELFDCIGVGARVKIVESLSQPVIANYD